MSSNFGNTLFFVRKAKTDDILDLVRMRLALQQHMEKVNDRILKHSETWELGLHSFYSQQIDSRDSIILVVSDNRKRQDGYTFQPLVCDEILGLPLQIA